LNVVSKGIPIVEFVVHNFYQLQFDKLSVAQDDFLTSSKIFSAAALAITFGVASLRVKALKCDELQASNALLPKA
jgi:hypothetical protein